MQNVLSARHEVECQRRRGWTGWGRQRLPEGPGGADAERENGDSGEQARRAHDQKTPLAPSVILLSQRTITGDSARLSRQRGAA
jgi:hypothetical protein